MRKLKASFVGLLAFIMVFALCPRIQALEYGSENPPQTFQDVGSDHWAYEYIESLVKRGAISGYPDGTFKPNNQVKRVEFAKILVVACCLNLPASAVSSFADVPNNHWAVTYIETSKPYMTYYKSGGSLLYKPEENAVREDIAVAVVKLKGYDIRKADLSLLETMFKDTDTISSSARPYKSVMSSMCCCNRRKS